MKELISDLLAVGAEIVKIYFSNSILATIAVITIIIFLIKLRNHKHCRY